MNEQVNGLEKATGQVLEELKAIGTSSMVDSLAETLKHLKDLNARYAERFRKSQDTEPSEDDDPRILRAERLALEAARLTNELKRDRDPKVEMFIRKSIKEVSNMIYALLKEVTGESA